MALKTRQSQIEAIAQDAARKAYRLVHKQLGSDGTVQGEAAGGELLQQEDIERVLPYGLYSDPPSGSGSVAFPSEGADVEIGESISVPSGVPLTGSCGTIYGAGGAYITPSNGGDSVCEPESGKFLRIGSGATEFIAMANLVLLELQSIKTWADAHVHTDPVSGTTSAPTVAMTAPSAVAATKGKVE